MNELFLQATKRQLRFATTKGALSTEDLWQLSLRDLDSIGQGVRNALKGTSESLLENPDPKLNAAQQENELRFEVIKAVITVKQDENKATKAAADKRAQRAFLAELLEKKKIGAMESLSEAEIEAKLKELGD